jgi:hypothetical protein
MNDSDRPHSEMTPQQFLISAAIFEGILLAIAFIGGWFTGINPTAQLRWSGADLLLGLLATLPMLAVLAVCMLSTLPALLQMRQLLKDMLPASARKCFFEAFCFRGLLREIRFWESCSAACCSGWLTH